MPKPSARHARTRTIEFISIKSAAAQGEDEPGIMEGTADVPFAAADLPEAAAVFDAATALDTTLAMVDPQPTLVELLVRQELLPRGMLAQIEINSNELRSRHCQRVLLGYHYRTHGEWRCCRRCASPCCVAPCPVNSCAACGSICPL